MQLQELYYILYKWNNAVIATTDCVFDSCTGSYRTTNHTWDDVVIAVVGVDLSSFDMLCARKTVYRNVQKRVF